MIAQEKHISIPLSWRRVRGNFGRRGLLCLEYFWEVGAFDLVSSFRRSVSSIWCLRWLRFIAGYRTAIYTHPSDKGRSLHLGCHQLVGARAM